MPLYCAIYHLPESNVAQLVPNDITLKLPQDWPANIDTKVFPYAEAAQSTVALILAVVQPIPLNADKLWHWYLGQFNKWRKTCLPEPLNTGGFARIKLPWGTAASSRPQTWTLQSPFVQGFQWVITYMCPRLAQKYLREAAFLSYYDAYEAGDWERVSSIPDSDRGRLAAQLFAVMLKRYRPNASGCNEPTLSQQRIRYERSLLEDQAYGGWASGVRDLTADSALGQYLREDGDAGPADIRVDLAPAPPRKGLFEPHAQTRRLAAARATVTIVVSEVCEKVKMTLAHQSADMEIQCPRNTLVFLDCLWWALDHLSRSVKP